MLCGADIRKPFPEKEPDIILERGGAAEDLAVPGPAVPLIPLRAVRRDVEIIALLAPDDIAEKLIQHGIAAFQPSGAFHFRMENHRTDPIG